ncbi:ArsR/SmtB family transcription factor [Nocardia noduli]|uniref:ArsR/SmtB family transcription factor n=1 Tax=Nocardia noduli TaxID=2815722 RepID=UPI001C243E65|nr:metalloregulator ArsR/SmtB family transcription factor [Nocardia noduli]
MTAAAKIFEALGDPVRRGILELVAGGEMSAGAVAEAVRAYAPISQPAVSQHLKVLREAGIVTVRAEGTRRIYAIDTAGIEVARTWLGGLIPSIELFAQPLDALATEVARGKRAARRAGYEHDRGSAGGEDEGGSRRLG